MGKLVNIDSLCRAVLRHEPYPHMAYDHAFSSPEIAEELRRTFPTEGFEWQIEYKIDQVLGAKGPAAQRHAKRVRLLFDVADHDPREPESLSPLWQQVARELCVPEYREAIYEVSGVDVRNLAMLAHFWRFEPGSVFRAHVDQSFKIATHLFYFGAGWQRDWGGCIRLLRSKDLDDVGAEYVPALNTSVLQFRTDQAWHGVSPLAAYCREERMVLQVWFSARREFSSADWD